METTVRVRRAVQPLLLCLVIGTPGVLLAEEPTAEPTPAEMEAMTPAEPATEIPAGVAGPLYPVTSGEEPIGDTGAAAEDISAAKEIYAAGDDTFLTVFWWWVLGIAGLAGTGALIWFIWGHRQPKRASRL